MRCAMGRDKVPSGMASDKAGKISELINGQVVSYLSPFVNSLVSICIEALQPSDLLIWREASL